jgi:splicing factor 1
MAWRNQGITGSNNIPLGKRRFGGDEEDGAPNGTATPNGYSNGNGVADGDRDVLRGRSLERAFIPLPRPKEN